jgi:hypothetical protein
MAQAALEKNKDPDKLSFTGAIAVIKRDLPLAAVLPPEQMKLPQQTVKVAKKNQTLGDVNVRLNLFQSDEENKS